MTGTLGGLVPPEISPLAALLLVLASFLTSGFTAIFGLGGGVTMLALLGLALPVAALIPVHGAVQLGSNLGRAWYQRSNIRWSVVLPFAGGAVPGALLGGAVVVDMPDAALKLLLGLFILAMAWLPMPARRYAGRAGLAFGGAVVSLLGMFLGATGPMAAAMLGQVFTRSRRTLIATHAATMVVLHGLKVIVFGAFGFAFWNWAPMVMAMIATGYLGTIAGSRALGALPEKWFRLAFRTVLSILALDMMARALAAL